MNQMPFEWHEQDDVQELEKVVLETQTIEAVIGLMANALIAVVRGVEQVEEVADER